MNKLKTWYVDMQQSARNSRRPELDGVRGLAVLTVIASHTAFFGLSGFGVLGVWIFFALSGYLLANPFLNRPETILSPELLSKFFLRRVLRILPAYLVCVVAIYGPASADMTHFIVNNAFFQDPTGHFWTVKQELILYLLLPVVFSITYPIRRLHGVVVTVLLLAAFGSHLLLDKETLSIHANSAYERLFAFPFLAGASVAASERTGWFARLKAQKHIGTICNATITLLLVAGIMTTDQNWTMAGLAQLVEPHRWAWTHYVLYSCVAALLIFLVNLQGRTGLSALIGSAPLRAIGVLGYSIYLIHPIVVRLLLNQGMPVGAPLFLSCMAISLVLAMALYGYVERVFWSPEVSSTKVFRGSGSH